MLIPAAKGRTIVWNLLMETSNECFSSERHSKCLLAWMPPKRKVRCFVPLKYINILSNIASCSIDGFDMNLDKMLTAALMSGLVHLNKSPIPF